MPAAHVATSELRLPVLRSLALTLRALATFVALDAGFRVLGFGRTFEAVRRRRPVGSRLPPAQGLRRARATFQAVQNATMLYFRRRQDCLPKALGTWHLLRRQGIAADLCFGVAKFPFRAHSWVEFQGEILDDDPARVNRYTVLQRFGS
ncbi:MAG TPA: lasso peptide biosynthesis B2 protein [Thermoanaerobaculia bacterium]